MRYRFADLELDLDQRRLSRDGNDLELSKLTFDVLTVLVQAAPDLVTHDQLVDGAWGEKRVVTPENLYQRITVLRKALEDDAQHPKYIESVRGTGFRLIPVVSHVVEKSGPRQKVSKWTWAAIGVAAVLGLGLWFTGRVEPPGAVEQPNAARTTAQPQDLSQDLAQDQGQRPDPDQDTDQDQAQPQPKSVAVLPFQNFSPDAEFAFYAMGIHDEILNHLAKLQQLRVTSRTSVTRFADTELGIPEIADELSVDAIIEGSVRYANERIRVTVQLVDGDSDQHLWSETYDHPIGDIFSIETDIATNVAHALRVTYGDDERALLERAPTTSKEAFASYLRGRGALAGAYYDSGTQFLRSADPSNSVPYALQQFERAVEADPAFAPAHVALSIAHIEMYWYGLDRSEARRHQALAAARRARELQPDLPEAHLAMAYYFYHGYLDYGAALQELDTIRIRLPSNIDVQRLYSAIYRRQGRWEDSVTYGLRAIELDPLHVENLWNMAATYLAMRRYNEGRQLIDRAIALAPDMRNPNFMKAVIERMDRGDTEAGLSLAESAAGALGRHVDALYWWHAFYARDYALALDVLNRNDTVDLPNAPHFYFRESHRALIFRLQGEDELARIHYERARLQIEEQLKERPNSRSVPGIRVMLGEALVATGERQRGIESVKRGLEELSPEVDAYFGRTIQYEAIMRVYLITDPFGTALPLLDEYLSVHGGGYSIEGLLPDPRLDPIRDDPRFRALVEKHRR